MTNKYFDDIMLKAKNIKIILTDVDGVLTDGSMNFFADADNKVTEIKKFCAYDGIACHILRDCAIKTGIITGGNAPATVFRAKLLGMNFLYQNFLSKRNPFEDILRRTGLQAQQAVYIGDDFIDLPVLRRAGLACSVKTAPQEVKDAAHYITQAAAGEGVLREVAEIVLKARGLWNDVMQRAENGKIGCSPKPELLFIDGKIQNL
ncbi:MAG: HAD hydrolase family protein [Elusimicrobiota bacterium]|nr:HAD hydrolase family protein [Elusimicrobiota bacterium]